MACGRLVSVKEAGYLKAFVPKSTVSVSRKEIAQEQTRLAGSGGSPGTALGVNMHQIIVGWQAWIGVLATRNLNPSRCCRGRIVGVWDFTTISVLFGSISEALRKEAHLSAASSYQW